MYEYTVLCTLVLVIYQEKCLYEVVVHLVLRLRLRVARRTLLAALHTAQTARLSALVQVVDPVGFVH